MTEDEKMRELQKKRIHDWEQERLIAMFAEKRDPLPVLSFEVIIFCALVALLALKEFV